MYTKTAPEPVIADSMKAPAVLSMFVMFCFMVISLCCLMLTDGK